MAIFKSFKCPNGLPPEECKHAPQIINNIANYFIKKQQANKTDALSKNINPKHFQNSQTVSKKQKQRYK